jgi:serine phosphatase RsbU (regulator of sigma subunit)/anti-sigma regulatory factor (Ser/Thr protein kinase)
LAAGPRDLDAIVGDAQTVREVFESMPLLLIGLSGPRHRYDAVNRTYRAAFARDDLIGTSVRDSFPEVEGQQWFEMMDRVLATGEPQVTRAWRLQVANQAGDGVDEYFFDLTFAPRHDAAGTLIGLNVFGVDATEQVLERQRMQAAAAAAVQRYERARDVITALQRQLLPAGLPVLPSARVAASYLLADADDAAGGDWFDAVPVPGGRVALVVGDVVGHGVAASAAMGQLRAVLQDRLDETGDVLAAVAAADRLARRVPGARAATVCVVLLDPAGGSLAWCSAGHPPPLVTGPDSARFLPASGQGPLGTGAAYTLRQDQLDPGQLVLLYSDGIIERPGRAPAEASAELAQVVGDLMAGRGFRGEAGLPAADRACTQTLELLVRQTGHGDDITLLAAQRQAPPPALKLGGPGLPPPPVEVTRTAVEAWVAAQGAGQEDQIALTHAAVELVTNAFEHARPGPGDLAVTVTAELDDHGEATLGVSDNGRWHEQPRPGDETYRKGHGFGLAMARSFADHLDIDRAETGTTVTFRRRLSHPARLLTADQLTHGTAPAVKLPELTLILPQPHAPSSRVAVHGPLDASTIEELGLELDRYTLGGTHELIVDLTAVTHLASAAVAEFYRTRPGSDERNYPLRLYAPAGSTAHHVLTLVGLPHTTSDPHADNTAPADT